MLDTPGLSERCRAILRDTSNDILFSTASSYEPPSRASRGRRELPERPEPYIRDRLRANLFESLAVALPHALRAAALPLIHRDPFDRLIIAQARFEKLPIMSSDPVFVDYGVENLLA